MTVLGHARLDTTARYSRPSEQSLEAAAERLTSIPIPRVLIVRDDGDARTIYSDTLSHHGYQTLAAVTGERALIPATAHPPDLALSDIVLPGMGGDGPAQGQVTRSDDHHADGAWDAILISDGNRAL